MDVLKQWSSLRTTVEPCIEISEGSHIGLKLRKDPSLLALIQMKLSGTSDPGETIQVPDDDVTLPFSEKVKASNFAATLLQIGNYKREAKNDGEVVAKIYFAKRKLVWETLERPLKFKIEISWSDISAIEGTSGSKGPDTLKIELAQPPLFFYETNPQPRKHTIWQSTTDFTKGEASRYRRHYLEFAEGTLEKHYEKLMLCDKRLKQLSRRGYPSNPSPIFGTEKVPDFYNNYGPSCAPVYNQHSRKWCTSQLPNIDNLQTGLAARNHLTGSYNSIPVMEHNFQAMAMAPINSAVNFAPVDEHYIHYVDPGSQYIESQPLIDGHILNESHVALWEHGFENASLEQTMELQQQQQIAVPPLNAYSSPAPNFYPHHFSVEHYIADTEGSGGHIIRESQRKSRELQEMEDQMMSEALASHADDPNLLRRVQSIEFLLGPQTHLFSHQHGLDTKLPEEDEDMNDSENTDEDKYINDPEEAKENDADFNPAQQDSNH